MWEAYVRYDASKQSMSIAMGGWGMSDQDVEHWCYWFSSYMERLPRRHDELWAHEVNFAENNLTSDGIRCLLETLTACKVSVLILKLHHNQLTTGTCVADFIVNSQGALRELHLSHNELESPAAAEIVLAAASARDVHGTFVYPSQSGHSAAPLWLRLEQNFVDPNSLSQHTDSKFERMRPGKVLCNVSSRACTPHCCVKHRHDPPPVHAKHLANQRNKTASSSQVSNGAQDLLTMLRSGKREEDTATSMSSSPMQANKKPAATNATTAAESQKDTQDEESDSGRQAVLADVLRWDDDELKWVRDVIEIPELKPEAAEESGRVKLSQEVGSKLGDQLKSMIGWAKPQEDKQHRDAEYSTPTRRFTKNKSTSGSTSTPEATFSQVDTDSAGRTPERSGGHDDEQPKTILRRSRRGAQPFGSEVKQVNGGFTLNPQAKEFYPVTGCLAPKVHELNLQAFLDPEAEEFTPSNSVQSATEPGEPLAKSAGTASRPLPSKNQEGKAARSMSSPDSSEASDNSLNVAITSSTGAADRDRDKEVPAPAEAQEKESCTEENEWSLGKVFFSVFGLSSAVKSSQGK